jgi:hypothetical protein
MSSNDAVNQHRMPQPKWSVFQSGLTRVFCYPFLYWNWKSASVAATIRGSVFVLAMGRHGGQMGALVEIVYVVTTAGFFAAIQQGLLGVNPRWAGRLGIVAGVPIAAMALDCLVHLAARVPNSKSVTVSVLVYSLISAAFHLHLMESGAMLVGEQGRSFLSDLKSIPRMVLSFVCAPAIWVASMAKGGIAEAEWEAGAAD